MRGVVGADLRPACVGVSVLLSTVSFIVVRDLSTVKFRAFSSGGTKRTERAACLASIAELDCMRIDVGLSRLRSQGPNVFTTPYMSVFPSVLRIGRSGALCLGHEGSGVAPRFVPPVCLPSKRDGLTICAIRQLARGGRCVSWTRWPHLSSHPSISLAL